MFRQKNNFSQFQVSFFSVHLVREVLLNLTPQSSFIHIVFLFKINQYQIKEKGFFPFQMLTVVQMFSRDTLGVIVTALYCKLMVILGIAFPMAETITDHVPKGFYQIFYVYLFLGSLFFLLFVYIDDLCRQSSARVLSHSRYTYEQNN